MYIFLTILGFLPLLELLGFIVIGPKIGLGWSLLWLALSTVAGARLFKKAGSGVWGRARQEGDGVFLIEDSFHSLCLLVAALLLIFPGFISDFMALPLLLPPFRHWLFRRLQKNPDGFVRRSYRSWTHTPAGGSPGRGPQGTPQTIDGEFRRLDSATELPKTPDSL